MPQPKGSLFYDNHTMPACPDGMIFPNSFVEQGDPGGMRGTWPMTARVSLRYFGSRLLLNENQGGNEFGNPFVQNPAERAESVVRVSACPSTNEALNFFLPECRVSILAAILNAGMGGRTM